MAFAENQSINLIRDYCMIIHKVLAINIYLLMQARVWQLCYDTADCAYQVSSEYSSTKGWTAKLADGLWFLAHITNSVP